MRTLLGLAIFAVLVTPAETRDWYVGVGAGTADLNQQVSDFDDGTLTAGSTDDSDTAWKIYGGYRVGGWAVEGGYIDMNGDRDSRPTFVGASSGGALYAVGPVSQDVEPDGFFLAAAFTLFGTKHVRGFGKVGYLRWDSEITRVDSTGTFRVSDDGTDTLYGAGVDVSILKRLALRGEWERYTDVGNDDVDLVSFGAVFRFGR